MTTTAPPDDHKPARTPIETPSLRQRILVVGLPALALVFGVTGTFLYLTLREIVDQPDRLAALLVAAGLAGVALGGVALVAGWRYATKPLREIIEIARRTAATRGELRLYATRNDTELGELTSALDEMLARIESALEEARRSEAHARRFLADAAHHLRTPVAGVHGAAEMVLRATDDLERDQIMSKLLRETARTTRLVGALMRMARLDRGEEVDRHPTDLVRLVREQVEHSARLAPAITHRFDADDDLETPLLLDAEAMREIVTNLLDNARRHAVRVIHVELRAVKLEAELRVRDDGLGLPEDFVSWAFERFVSLDGHGGSGMGLPVARAIARAHGGDLFYERGMFVTRIPLLRSKGVATSELAYRSPDLTRS